MAYKPDLLNDLRDATKLSQIYASLAVLDRATGRSSEAAELETRRLELWKEWDRNLPNNPFVSRQLADLSAGR